MIVMLQLVVVLVLLLMSVPLALLLLYFIIFLFLHYSSIIAFILSFLFFLLLTQQQQFFFPFLLSYFIVVKHLFCTFPLSLPLSFFFFKQYFIPTPYHYHEHCSLNKITCFLLSSKSPNYFPRHHSSKHFLKPTKSYMHFYSLL